MADRRDGFCGVEIRYKAGYTSIAGFHPVTKDLGMAIPAYLPMIESIASPADEAVLIEDIRIYTNWVLVKTGKWSLSTLFRGMPGFDEHPGMGTWMGDWIGRPAKASALELLSSRFILHRAVGMACLKSLLPVPRRGDPPAMPRPWSRRLPPRHPPASSAISRKPLIGVRWAARSTSWSSFRGQGTSTGMMRMKSSERRRSWS